jgi:hypoxanthine phosphoribosyltransferase
MDRIRIEDKEFEIYIDQEKIQQRVAELAADINEDYAGSQPLLLSLLKGSFVFTADLARHMSCPLEIEFVRYSSYSGTNSTGVVTEVIGLTTSVEGRDVVIVEDIVDSGLTILSALESLKKKSPKSIRVASLLLKPDALKFDVPVDYIGFRIPNDFIVGYGLDYNEYGRDLPGIYRLVDESS